MVTNIETPAVDNWYLIRVLWANVYTLSVKQKRNLFRVLHGGEKIADILFSRRTGTFSNGLRFKIVVRRPDSPLMRRPHNIRNYDFKKFEIPNSRTPNIPKFLKSCVDEYHWKYKESSGDFVEIVWLNCPRGNGCNSAFNFQKVVMTSSSGHIFRVTDPLWGESSSHKGQWRGALMFSLIYAWTNDGVNNQDAGDLRRHCAQYDATPMLLPKLSRLDISRHCRLQNQTLFFDN